MSDEVAPLLGRHRAPEDSPPAEPEVPLLRLPADGTPEPITTAGELALAVDGLSAGHGPLAVDAERASGYRYSQRAYLVQLRRAGYGTVLIDPIALPDLTTLNTAMLRRRVDPARGPPGPALSERTRPVPEPAVRHRARRTPTWRGTRGPRHHGRVEARNPAREGSLRRGLEHPPAAPGLARLRRARRRTAYRASRRAGGRTRRRRQNAVGRAGVRGRPNRPASPTAGRPVATYLRDSCHPRPAPVGHGAGLVDQSQRAGR